MADDAENLSKNEVCLFLAIVLRGHNLLHKVYLLILDNVFQENEGVLTY